MHMMFFFGMVLSKKNGIPHNDIGKMEKWRWACPIFRPKSMMSWSEPHWWMISLPWKETGMPGSTARALQKTRWLGVPFGFQVIWFPEVSSFLFGTLILERTSLPDCKGPGRACSRRCGHRCCPGKDLCKIFLDKQSQGVTQYLNLGN